MIQPALIGFRYTLFISSYAKLISSYAKLISSYAKPVLNNS